MNNLFLHTSAVVSADGLYRLTRIWDAKLPLVVWVMLNPSTADALIDDPTIRRCSRFARDWRCGGIEVVNLFAARSTNPGYLSGFADPVGPENDTHIVQAANRANVAHLVAAWGAHAHRERSHAVLSLLSRIREVECLGLTRAGQPRHPLYVAAKTQVIPFVPPAWKEIDRE